MFDPLSNAKSCGIKILAIFPWVGHGKIQKACLHHCLGIWKVQVSVSPVTKCVLMWASFSAFGHLICIILSSVFSFLPSGWEYTHCEMFEKSCLALQRQRRLRLTLDVNICISCVDKKKKPSQFRNCLYQCKGTWVWWWPLANKVSELLLQKEPRVVNQ